MNSFTFVRCSEAD